MPDIYRSPDATDGKRVQQDGDASGGLFDHWHEVGIDDPLIGGHEPKAVNACRCYDSPVCGVAQRITQDCDLGGDLHVKGYKREAGAWIKSGEEVPNSRQVALRPTAVRRPRS